MSDEPTAVNTSKSADRAFNRIYIYLAAWLVSVFFILFQYHSNDQSTTSLIATLTGLAAVSAYCCVAVFNAFRAAVFHSGRAGNTSSQ
jgi:hypothetical protein